MRISKQIIPLFFTILLCCSCSGVRENSDPVEPNPDTPEDSATPTVGVLADSFFFGCAYVDGNGNGEIDPDDPGLKGALFIVNVRGLGGLTAKTSASGCATIVVPGGLSGDRWPVSARMQPPPDTSYELVSTDDVVLVYPKAHADFLFNE